MFFCDMYCVFYTKKEPTIYIAILQVPLHWLHYLFHKKN